MVGQSSLLEGFSKGYLIKCPVHSYCQSHCLLAHKTKSLFTFNTTAIQMFQGKLVDKFTKNLKKKKIK